MKSDRFTALAVLAAGTFTLCVAWAAPIPSQQANVKASNAGPGDQFGRSVAVAGDTMVVGADRESSNATGVNGIQSDNSATDSGAAYILVRRGTDWSQQAYLKAANTGASDRFGWSVAVSGDTVVVGAPFEGSNATGINGDPSDNGATNSGAAYIFVRSGTNWIQRAYLKASNTEGHSPGGDSFGYSVAVSGDTVVVGAPFESSNATGVNGDQNDNSAGSSGAVYVFVRDGTVWRQQAYLKASNTGAGDNFGRSVAVSGDTAVVGAPFEASNATGVNGNQTDNHAISSGAAYVFVRVGTDWSQQAYLKASNTEGGIPGSPFPGYYGDFFGSSVALSGDTVVVGAPYEDSNAAGVNGNPSDNNATDSGAAYVFVRSGTNWSQQTYLKPSNTEGHDWFGFSVAVSGDMAVVGALYEDGDATEVNGNQSNDNALDSGAAYFFVRRGTTWIQQAYLKASNTEATDMFGNSVAIAGDTGVVGAWTASNTGAAYVFTGLGIGPRLGIMRDRGDAYLIRFTGVPDVAYQLQRAAGMNGPWDTLATINAPASGLVEFHDTPPPTGQTFYRTVQP